jgi:fructokinase
MAGVTLVYSADRSVPLLFAAIEAGGTKFICAVGNSAGEIVAEERIPTIDVASTFESVFGYFRAAQTKLGRVSSVGLASFGPLVLDPESERYGTLLKTPKAGWSDLCLRGLVAREFQTPVGLDTDVNAAALGEARWGKGRDLPIVAYVTVGTGIGGGFAINGRSLHGMTHPEIGHIHVRRHVKEDAFDGVCPFHGDCLEGLASGTAIRARFGKSLAELPPGHPAWELEADYLGQLCAQLVFTVAPYRILIGGGVMNQLSLFPSVRLRMRHWLGDYCQIQRVHQDDYVSPPGLGAHSGIKGALALAIDAHAQAACTRTPNTSSLQE